MSNLAPIPCREDLIHAAQQKFYSLGNAVEVGVYKGDFAAHNLKIWTGHYYLVDPWIDRPGAYEETSKKLASHMDRVFLEQATSTEAVKKFSDNFFDFIYIDAAKDFKSTLQDCMLWYDKLRPGGLMGGDDYGDANSTDFLPRERYDKTYGDALRYKWGVISAVQQFASIKKVQLHITWHKPHGTFFEAREYPVDTEWPCFVFPAWYIVKPY
jgi:hypothetical protein